LSNSSAAFAASQVAAGDPAFFTALTILVTIPIRAPTSPNIGKRGNEPPIFLTILDDSVML